MTRVWWQYLPQTHIFLRHIRKAVPVGKPAKEPGEPPWAAPPARAMHRVAGMEGAGGSMVAQPVQAGGLKSGGRAYRTGR
ncbi:MAG: hypothetical protein H6568_09750 [Lewinellaceae bacterium]|nr:hypothetical protein [Lewinellaceae bacterium]